MPKPPESRRQGPPALAAYVHARGSAAPTAAWLASLRAAGLEPYAHAELEGARSLGQPLSRLGALCARWQREAPGRPLLLLRAPLHVEAAQLAWLAGVLDGEAAPLALTALGNATPELDPAAGLAPPPGFDPDRLNAQVLWLGRERLHAWSGWPEHFLALNAAAVAALAEPALGWSEALPRLLAAGGRLVVAERLYLHDPSRPAFTRPALEPHEEARPAAWGALSARLHDWLAAPGADAALEALQRPGPTTLHITHSWGGGVAQWVRTFIAAAPGRHLQLRSEGPQGGQGAGQRLSLHAGSEPGPPVERWWLQPPIEALDDANPQYAELLQDTCRRFGVGRIIVSSLVGHALDALRTGLPTVQVLHDQFPAWPLLDTHPGRHAFSLEAAWAAHGAPREFPHTPLQRWRELGAAYHDAVAGGAVQLAAPTHAVAEVRRALDPAFADIPIAIIPHGEPLLPGQRPVAARQRGDGRLRVVIPGRMQAGKGAALLREALPGLTRHAQLTLLGASQGGQAFFGIPGVNVVNEFRREDLPALLAEIGPHLALLLSVVPETHSYTLSEMQSLGIPVLATRVGALAERIDDGRTGWLADPEAGAVVAALAALHAAPERIAAARAALAGWSPASPGDMVAAYDALCVPRPVVPPAPPQDPPPDLSTAQAVSQQDIAARTAGALQAARGDIRSLQREVAQRTDWALDVSRELEREVAKRERWVAQLEADLAGEIRRREEWVARLDAEVTDAHARIAALTGELAVTRSHLETLQGEHDRLSLAHATVLASSSWRLTRPLRVARRMGDNFMQARAWNPLRWPSLTAQFARNLATLGTRGTLDRMQRGTATAQPSPDSTPLRVVQSTELPAALPVSDSPRASIVIPVFNHLEVTVACLASLAASRCDTPFEVIVVDDASLDGSAGALAGVAGLQLVRNEENLGFIHSCNRGAQAARGEFLVLLNNDTEVGDGWLDRLLETFDQRPDAGLVGAKLVYPDGRLQECGGLVFADGSGWNYGRFDDPDRPEYRCLRETDYCSGACIALRTDWFRANGGFDARYAPAYYEDTDLAFRVREAGMKVYVQPACTVVHHEGVSSGTDESSGVKRHQAINRETFLERWKQQLAGYPQPVAGPGDLAGLRRARDHHLKGRVLVVDAYTPEPDQDSGSVRLLRVMRCLQDLGWGVSFFADNRAWAGGYTRALQAMGVEAWHAPWLDSVDDFLARHGGEYAAVVVSRHYVATHYLAPVRRHCPQAKFIFDTVDLHYLREQRLAELEDSAVLRGAARQTRRDELAVVNSADATLVVSEAEVGVLAQDAPGARVFVLSNIHEVRGSATPFAQRRDLFFMGGYQHPPNVDAAQWFVGEIWPRVRERLPDVNFHLVGSKAPDSVRALGGNGVRFHGFVPDVAPFLDGCRLAVAPLRYGAGVKGKVNHSMSHGQPVVATPMAIEGMHAQDERDILVAGDAASFADAVVRLYEDEALWNRLSEGGLANIREHFSVDAARAALRMLFSELGMPGHYQPRS